VGAWS